MAQHIPVPLSQSRLYDILDELLTDGVIVHQTAIRPYTRIQVADMLEQAQKADTVLNIRQKKRSCLLSQRIRARARYDGEQPCAIYRS